MKSTQDNHWAGNMNATKNKICLELNMDFNYEENKFRFSFIFCEFDRCVCLLNS